MRGGGKAGEYVDPDDGDRTRASTAGCSALCAYNSYCGAPGCPCTGSHTALNMQCTDLACIDVCIYTVCSYFQCMLYFTLHIPPRLLVGEMKPFGCSCSFLTMLFTLRVMEK